MASPIANLRQAVLRRRAIYQLSRQIERHGSSALVDLPAEIEKTIDSSKISKLLRDVRGEYQANPTSAAKYAQPREWLFLNTLRAANLGLHTKPGLRILDIGCGPGYFMAVAQALGHEIEGVDAPQSVLSPVERLVYSGLLDILRCSSRARPLLIERFVPMPPPERPYDLITAFWICFNRHQQPDEWSCAEWRYFVEDALQHLNQGGRLFLDLNENAKRFGKLGFYDDATLQYFQSVGSVDRGRVLVMRK